MIKRRLALLALEGVLLLTACGQTKDISTLTTPPPQSAAQVIAPAGDGAQGGAENSSTVETVEETEPAGGEDTPKLADSAKTPSGKMEVTPPPTAPEEPVMPAPAPEDKPAPAPTPAPAQKPAEKQEEKPAPTPEPAPTPKPAASGNIYSIAEAIQAGNEYARAQYGVTIDTAMTTADSSYFPGTADSVAWLGEGEGRRTGASDRRRKGQRGRHLRLPRRHGRRRDGQRVCAVQLYRPLRCGIGRIHRGGAVRINQLNTRPEDRQRELPVFCVGRKDEHEENNS